MSKNLTRKGLALGAVVALGSSLFAGAPAFAGNESAKITLVPAAGTTYTTLIGASFELKNELDPTIKTAGLENKDVTELTYLVTNTSAQSLNIDLDGASGADYGDVRALTADAAADITGSLPTGAASYTTTAKAIAITSRVSGGSAQSADAADAGFNRIKVTSSTDSTDPFSVTVQAFIDDNNNGKIDTFELTSPARTLNFIKASAATVTTAITSSTIGTSTIKGTVVIGNDVNNASLVGQVSIGFFKNATAVKLVVGGSSVDTTDVQWDSTNSVLTNSTNYTLAATAANGTGNTITAATYTAKAYFGVARSVIGSESAAVAPTTGTVTSADNTDYLVATPSANVIKAGNTTTTVRSGYTGAINFTSKVTNSSNAVVKIAGVKVKVTLSKGTTFTSGHEITAGGKTLTSTSGAVSFETTTSALGVVAFSATSNKGTKNDTFDVRVQVLTDDAGYETGDATAVTFSDATIASLDVPSIVGYNGEVSVAKGGSVSLGYDLRDNFGAPSAVAGTYRLSFAAQGAVTGGAEINALPVAVSGGKATLNWTDNTLSATGKYTVRATLQKLNAAGTGWDTLGTTADVVVNVGTAAVAAISVPADAASGVALEPEDFVTHDLRLDVNTKTWAGLAYGSAKFAVSGSATSASGAVVPGAAVTISAKGLMFVARNNASDDTDATIAVDTITVRANASGAYAVDAYSHTAGDVKITVTSGSATKTVVAKFSHATTADADSLLAITGSATTKSGRSTGYVIALTDAWGNAIKGAVTIKVEQAGAGYLTSTPTAVSAVDGKTNVTLITQPADAGLTTLTVTYDVAGSDTDVVAKKSILVGVSASVSKAATSRATVKNASGLAVKVVRGSKSVTKTATSDNFKVSLKGGSGSVKVYVEGILVASKK